MDPLEQCFVKDLCLDLMRDGRVVQTEFHRLVSRWYSPRELVPLLGAVGFGRVEVFGDFTDEPARADHDTYVYVARKAA